jgi:hypothetical protein
MAVPSLSPQKERNDVKKVLSLAAILFVGLAVLNARIEATRHCGCQRECWCKKPVLRHFRWVLPVPHRAVSEEWKAGRDAGV